MKIQSSFSHTVPIATQQAIQNACANIGGLEAVELVWVNENTDLAPCYDVFNDKGEQEYLFSIDSEGNQTYER